jgi:hypothetical protein
VRALAFIVASLTLLLAGCSDPHEGQVCTASHEEPYTYFISTGKVLVPIVGRTTVCDRWEAA